MFEKYCANSLYKKTKFSIIELIRTFYLLNSFLCLFYLLKGTLNINNFMTKRGKTMKIQEDYEKKCIQYLELLNTIEELERQTELSLAFQKQIGKRLQKLEREILRQDSLN